MSHNALNSKNYGLYDERNEKDSCGVGFIAHLNGKKSHWIVQKGIEILENMEHRGAVGAEKNAGDGAGILVQIPHEFFLKECTKAGFSLPHPGEYGAGIVFLSPDEAEAGECREIFERCVRELGQGVIGWRRVPTVNAEIGPSVRKVEPSIWQIFVRRGKNVTDQDSFERKLYVIRKYVEKNIRDSGIKGSSYFYVPSLSIRTMTYKGMLTTHQLKSYYADLSDPSFKSALALAHSRFSTNTFPSWRLAHPFRFLAHNGEINTLRGNINWMRSREQILSSTLFTPDEIAKLRPLIDESQSDSATLDNVVELLVMGGRPLPHVMMMLIPEAWATDREMSQELKAFYEYHGAIMEPWDGPASVAFTDGKMIGATLDRNGLRPSRYLLTHDDVLVMASEAGVLSFPPENIKLKGRLQPGRMFVASIEEGRIIPDDEIKKRICAGKQYAKWLAEEKIEIGSLKAPKTTEQPDHAYVTQRQALFGYTSEDLELILGPMAMNSIEPLGSMGTDTPLAVLSDKSNNLFNYFYQLFAQVTNPPIDPIREESIMSLVSFVGGEDNLLAETPEHCRVIELPQPVLTNDDLERLRWVDRKHFQTKTISMTFRANRGEKRLERALDRMCRYASDAIAEGYNVILLSDRGCDSGHATVPSLLAVGALHHHLIREGLRSKCGLIIETGEAREVHHFALLLGYGASAINPYLAFESVEDLRLRGILGDIDRDKARKNYIKALNKGLLKIISKMGISTIQSYIGSQIFEAVGISQDVIDKYFTGSASRIGGVGLDVIEEETLIRHQYAYQKSANGSAKLESGGQYQWRARGERHTFNPMSIPLLQQATRTGSYETFKEFSRVINDQSKNMVTIRGLLDFTNLDPVPIDEVEPVNSIVRRFFTGAMSFGSISKEAHETLAIAMNRLGGKSNTGEGGEDVERLKPQPDGESKRSAIKQVASGRFGVTSNYLVNADELQIKMAQGAKPGEGGQLPGRKVDKVIARVRHSTPGVGLISPPPHHDIYSIEDLAQLIFDLKNANDRARINVKLVSEVGVGTIAAGVAKGHAEAVLISGHDGGTGASPWSSIKRAGLPWELGVAETHQTLMLNNLRSRIVLQTDGRLLTGRDVAIAALFGAEEWGSATGSLIASGCIMMRKCHLNTCPVGVATQDEELRKFFSGKPEYIISFFTFMATELRELMATLGFRTVNEMIGRTDKLAMRKDVTHWKAKTLDLAKLLTPAKSSGCAPYCRDKQDFGLETQMDYKFIEQARPALDTSKPVRIEAEIRNRDRAVGTLLSAEVSRKYGEEALPHDTITIKLKGSAGQSFLAFGAKGLTFELEGEANDYFCKGLSGAKAILYPPKASNFVAQENVIVGNVAFYGATSGEAYIRGIGGERFCVRNSGAKVVVESVGDHGCEYMTGGRVVILGPVGKNFAAGMSGGVAYIYDPDDVSRHRINMEMVELEDMSDPDEISDVRTMIQQHEKHTQSPVARAMLDNWEKAVSAFIKVMPIDYKRALAEMYASPAQAVEGL
ncbi:MAG: glutamate synthase large subunit [Nitrospinae bacterium]|nr:glutamate synthase large subunit [Nitrospinota bacterium]MBF0633499.1 glutamate synthase large subunit [Nitrospinota bacterium]